VAAFLAWCEDNQVPSIAAVQPLHVAAWIEMQQQEHAAPTVKQRLAALRHLFDWLVTGQVMPVNPVARCGSARYHLIAERLPANDGWDWTVWRQGDEPQASRHGYAPGAITAMAAAEGAAWHWQTRAATGSSADT
jgi:site-specific recombinase XerC